MKKQAFLCGLLGIPIGISIGFLITVLISLSVGDGYYSPCAPALTEQAGSEIGAVVLQTILCGILGAVCAASSVIWEIDRWSIVKQTGVYFLILFATMLPIAYICHWMEHSVGGFLIYAVIFIGIFIFMCLVQYIIWKNKIKKINRKINNE